MTNRRAAVILCAASCAMVAVLAGAGASNATSNPMNGGAAASVFGPAIHTAATDAATAAEAANLDQLRTALGLGAEHQLSLRSVIVDADGSRHLRLDRTFRGLQILGGDLVVRKDPSGKVVDVTWNNGGAGDVKSIEPVLDRIMAQDAGRAEGVRDASTQPGTLMVYAAHGAPVLAYDVVTEGKTEAGLPTMVHTIIDAQLGTTITSYDQLQRASGEGLHSKSVQIETTRGADGYVLKDSKGNVVVNYKNTTTSGSVFSNTTDTWGNGSTSNPESAGVDALYGTQKTYAFLSSNLQRNGIWGDGRGVQARVHYDDNLVNAFWDGRQLTLGDGKDNARPLSALDVVAHEISHGITGATAALVYRGEPGGLNEASSDILGAAVEFYANNPADPGDYLIGEKVDMRGDGSPLRYMDQPSKDGKSVDCWAPSIGSLNVHYNSGPMNHWFFMAAEGSGSRTVNGVQYNSPTCGGAPAVQGAGRDAAVKIWYRALATKMTSSTDYKGAREALIKSAVELYGAGSRECTATETSLNAIAVPAGRATCAKTAPAQGAAQPTAGQSPAGEVMVLGAEANSVTTQVRKFTVAPGQRLSFDVSVQSAETTRYSSYDRLSVRINGVEQLSVSNLDGNAAGQVRTVDLAPFAGQTVDVQFVAINDATAPTVFTVRSVSVK